jgi:hypothetical protein
VGLGTLRTGWAQPAVGSKVLGAYSHRTVLVGASVRPGDDLFLTIDHDLHAGLPPLAPAGCDTDNAVAGSGNLEDHLGESDDALTGAARAQMLVYLALRSAPASQLRTVPVPADRAARHRRSGLTTPLEGDGLTFAMRAGCRSAAAPDSEQHALRAGIRSMGLDDVLSCRIPGTEVHLGMSRSMFAACERLREEDLAIAQRTPGLRAEDQAAAYEELSDEAQEERRLAQNRILREQEEARPRLRPLLRDAYERGSTSDWRDLLRRPQEPKLDLEGDESLLEAATPETYLVL